MVRVARFEKVSLRRFVTDWVATFPQQTVEQAVAAYERIRLPERGDKRFRRLRPLCASRI